MKKSLTILLTLALLVALFVGTSYAEDEKITITFMHMYVYNEDTINDDAETLYFYQMIDEFLAEHPNVELVQETMDQADYHTKIQAMAAAGDLPDLFNVKGSWFTTFVDNELLYPMNDYIDALDFKDAYRSGIFDAATVDGVIYGTPRQYAITSVVFYNKQMWADAGYEGFAKTWDEFFAANEYFKEQGIWTVALGNIDKWPFESCILSALGDRFTGTEWTQHIIDNDGEAKFTDQEFVDALTFAQKLATEGCFNPDFNTINNNQSQVYFTDGKASCTIEGYWAVASFLSTCDDAMLENIGIALLPTVDGGKGEANCTSGGCGWYLSANSNLEGEKLDLCMELLFKITGVQYSELVAEKSGLTTACAVDEVDSSNFDVLTKSFLDATNGYNYTPIYDILMEGSVIDVMNAGIQDLLNGTITPEQLAADIQAEQDAL